MNLALVALGEDESSPAGSEQEAEQLQLGLHHLRLNAKMLLKALDLFSIRHSGVLALAR